MERTTGFILALGLTALAWAQAPAEAPRKREWCEALRIGGDFRLRYEGFQQDGADDRYRERFRLRLGLDSKLSDTTRFRAALRTGDAADPVSDNVTFSDGFGKKGFTIAEAYIAWAPAARSSVTAGKFPWRDARVTSDLAWDDDVNVEGLAEKARFDLGGGGKGAVTLGLWQSVLMEQGAAKETYLFGGQAYFERKAGETDLIAGVSYEEFVDPSDLARATFNGKLGGNPLTNAYTTAADGKFGALESDFRILEGFVRFRTGRLGLFAHYYRNNGAFNDQDAAWFARASYGSTKGKGGWEARYTYYYLEAESLLYAYVQSDITIATNSRSHRLDFEYATTPWSTLGATVYLTRRIDDPADAFQTLVRFQLDFTIRL